MRTTKRNLTLKRLSRLTKLKTKLKQQMNRQPNPSKTRNWSCKDEAETKAKGETPGNPTDEINAEDNEAKGETLDEPTAETPAEDEADTKAEDEEPTLPTPNDAEIVKAVERKKKETKLKRNKRSLNKAKKK